MRCTDTNDMPIDIELYRQSIDSTYIEYIGSSWFICIICTTYVVLQAYPFYFISGRVANDDHVYVGWCLKDISLLPCFIGEVGISTSLLKSYGKA